VEHQQSPIGDLKAEAARVAAEMLTFAEKYKDVTTQPDAHQLRLKNAMMAPELRERFIRVRAELYRRGIYDPILARFDSHTAPPVDAHSVAQQLALVADQL
jgi:hypothetical protein